MKRISRALYRFVHLDSGPIDLLGLDLDLVLEGFDVYPADPEPSPPPVSLPPIVGAERARICYEHERRLNRRQRRDGDRVPRP